jgi:hypothetical protein
VTKNAAIVTPFIEKKEMNVLTNDAGSRLTCLKENVAVMKPVA